MQFRSILLSGTCVALGVMSAVCMARAADAPAPSAPAPATQPAGGATTAPTARGPEQILNEIQATSAQIGEALASPAAVTDPAKRKELAPRVVPAFKKMLALADELSGTSMKGMAPQMQSQMLTILDVFDDADAHARLEQSAKNGDVPSRGALLLSQWIKSSADANAQTKILDQATELAKANPENQLLTEVFMGMSQIGAATPELKDRAAAVITDNMKGQTVQQLKTELAGEKKLHALENKPLAIKAVRHDGSMLNTADLKGKVILVDFWATWCGPCLAELPRVKKAYADFHDKGLEVVGVSCDESGDKLKKFLEANKDMPWPQLFDEKTAGWHPLATEYGINAIPTMFLIDKKGVLRSVTARENFEEMIPRLLAE
jgi:thiol-disulfide isomerase/thioredoxin